MSLPTIPTLPPQSIGLPKEVQGLERLARNLRWTWRRETLALFRKAAPGPWPADTAPLRALKQVADWSGLVKDKEFLAAIAKEEQALKEYLESADKAWFAQSGRHLKTGPAAYFCAEYSFHESMNQYAGGLGILAGDHVKEASDLGLPFVAIGLFYRRGFFHQMIDFSGRQEAIYPTLDPDDLCLLRAARPGTQEPLDIELPLPGRSLKAAVWVLQVGRTPVLLLDTDHPDNRPEDRRITSQLYTGGREMRVLQEFVLGAGGVRALDALGICPGCHHLNEGHSAFLLLERLRQASERGLTMKEARAVIAKNAVITIHTPVPEGNERFDAAQVKALISPLLEGSKVKPDEVIALGAGADGDPSVFDMTAFALRHTAKSNGVSLLHGNTADGTWRKIHGRKVGGVTNGVHMPTWLGPEMKALFEQSGAGFDLATATGADEGRDRPDWEAAAGLDDAALWAAHLAQKQRLIGWAGQRMADHHARLGEGPGEIRSLLDGLDPDAFLIGFARRFATYKRAWLLFQNLSRVARLMNAQGRKVQVIFAGKSHPHDRGGQAVVQKVYDLTQHPKLKGKVFLLEDYDMECGRMLVQGVDLWLNNPRRPLEASGTSGMKAAANGAPNASILDGWWDEAAVEGDDRNGWVIGTREMLEDVKAQDKADAASLYAVLEKQVIPCFFDRGADGVPRKWTAVMKRAIATSLYSFSTARMIRDYVDDMYAPCAAE